MLTRIAFFALPLIGFAQALQPETAAPPDVDQALRARVTEFYQDHVDGNFRKAFDLVAEDTKDYYFASTKTQFKGFKIDKIEYLGDFTKAVVTLTVQRTVRVQLQDIPLPTTGPVTWKIENGEWVWYNDPDSGDVTPMGKSAPDIIKPNPDGTLNVPKKITPDMVSGAARRILEQQQSGVSKSEVTLATDKASSEDVVFHNAVQGSVQVKLEVNPAVAGFRAELDKTEVNAGENAVVKLRYEPRGGPPASPVTIRLMVAPFGQMFLVTVKFAPPKDADNQ